MVRLSVWQKLRPKEVKPVKRIKRTGKIVSIPRDAGRISKPPGKRISKSGKRYYEYRKNRSDIRGTRL